jgi:uncharacterized membrane protein YdjX (TVP38/TMEM64 family)
MRIERRTLVFAGGLLLGSAAVSLGLGSLLHALLPVSLPDVRHAVRACGRWGALVVVLLITLTIVALPISTIPLELVAGLAYGVVAGSALVLVGHLLGALIAFLLARRLGRPLLRRWLGERALHALDSLTACSGFGLVLGMRLLPVFDFKLVSYACGLTPLRLRTYLLATLAGIAAPILLLATIGASAVARPREAVLLTGLYSLAVAATLAFIAHPLRAVPGAAGVAAPRGPAVPRLPQRRACGGHASGGTGAARSLGRAPSPVPAVAVNRPWRASGRRRQRPATVTRLQRCHPGPRTPRRPPGPAAAATWSWCPGRPRWR